MALGPPKEVFVPDSLHESDALVWSERQAALPRQVAAGEPVHEAAD